MKIEQATDTIARFFNDLIGAWVPGAVLAFGLAIIHLGPTQLQSMLKLADTAPASLIFAGVLFAIGHALIAIHEQVLKKLLVKARLAKPFDEAEARMRKSYEWFAELARGPQGRSDHKDWGYNDLRSVALSVSTEAASLGRRFMFISLLCNGVGTALAILALDFVVCSLLLPQLLFSYNHAAPWLTQVFLIFGVALVLFKHGEGFYNRAMTTPFSVATAELKFKQDVNAG